ncbi:hypothetical protein [Streptomyces sp. NPDC016675]|uniref:hypothetical protein n=1 Tax=Streptomyces sp. NPDC016675 TaxID=3364970 RepID=UPI0036F59ED9
MTTAGPGSPATTPPSWPHCGQDATPADSVGCRGINVGSYAACLAHLQENDRAAYLAALSPGADIDHRGTPFTSELLGQLLAVLRDPDTGHIHIGDANFEAASLSCDARFDEATFSGDAGFPKATFSAAASSADHRPHGRRGHATSTGK